MRLLTSSDSTTSFTAAAGVAAANTKLRSKPKTGEGFGRRCSLSSWRAPFPDVLLTMNTKSAAKQVATAMQRSPQRGSTL
jgi:hypothetical protein